jgi:hypothetical protein
MVAGISGFGPAPASATHLLTGLVHHRPHALGEFIKLEAFQPILAAVGLDRPPQIVACLMRDVDNVGEQENQRREDDDRCQNEEYLNAFRARVGELILDCPRHGRAS